MVWGSHLLTFHLVKGTPKEVKNKEIKLLLHDLEKGGKKKNVKSILLTEVMCLFLSYILY